MKTKSLQFIIICLSVFYLEDSISAQGQKSFQWISQIGGKAFDINSGIVIDSKNNLYLAGSFSDTLFAKDLTIASTGSKDIFIAKYDVNGKVNKLWSGGGSGNDLATCIAADMEGNVIIGGFAEGDITFINVNNPSKGNRLFIAMLNSKGKVSWISSINIEKNATLLLLETDLEGNIYASGSFSGSLNSGEIKVESNGRQDIFVAKLNSSGIITKMFSLGSAEDDTPLSIAVNRTGEIALAGSFKGNFAIDENQLEAQAKNNSFLAYFNKDMKCLWSKTYYSKEFVKTSSVKFDHTGNVYTAGNFDIDFELEDTVINSKGYTDCFILKNDPDGNLLWVTNFGSEYYDYVNNLLVDNNGGAILTGSIGDTLIIDETILNPLTQGNTASVLQFSSNGSAVWGECISANGRTFTEDAALDTKGNLYITGAFHGKIEINSSDYISKGDQDIFFAKYFNCPSNDLKISGNPYICPGMTTELSVQTGYSNVIWNDSITAHYITAVKSGLYNVSVMDSRGCIYNDSIIVTIAENKAFSIGEDISLLVGGSQVLTAPVGFIDYKWHDNSTGSSFLAKAPDNTPGKYDFSLKATDSSGCLYSDTLTIDFYRLSEWIDPSDVILEVFPNPVAGSMLYCTLTSEYPSYRVIIELTDNNGIEILTEYFENYISGSKMQIDLGNILPGTYFFKVKNELGLRSKAIPIIKQ